LAAPALNRLLFLLTVGLLLAGGAWLRLAQIDRRPFHADEAVQAYQTWHLLRGDGYTYDPADKHGPFLYYAAAGAARVAGWTPAALDERRLRLVTFLAGLLTLALCAASAPRLGVRPAIVATALLALAPLAILYDTYFVQEAWFCLETWALFFALLRLLEKPNVQRAIVVGLLAGLMQATKETSVLHFAALGAAALVVRSPRELAREWRRGLLALAAALVVYLAFYSNFGTRWSGVVDGVRTYFTYAGRAAASAHDQPWYYYLRLLSPHSVGGVGWGEPVLLAVAGLGAIAAFRPGARPAHRAVAVFTLVLLAIYSVIPYKTPWLLLTPYVGLVLLAGLGVTRAAAWRPGPVSQAIAAVLTFALLAGASRITRAATDRYAGDERNPYLYQATSPQFPLLLARLQEIKAAAGRPLRLAVVSPDHAWPLPWYLRDEPTTGYFTSLPANVSAYDALIIDSRLDAPAPPIATRPFGLRPDVLLWLGTTPKAAPP
jgi:uncharacterized protein (TIGR03663 family)